MVTTHPLSTYSFDEHILWLQVPVDDVSAMEEPDPIVCGDGEEEVGDGEEKE